MRDEGRLISFTARFASVVTASEERLGLSARKTLIMPGRCATASIYAPEARRRRLGRHQQDADGHCPRSKSPGPASISTTSGISEGGILMALTGAERELDHANQRSAQDELMRQARAPAQMQLARNNAMRMVARSFAMPLRLAASMGA
jgi:hypothetical protein